MKTRNQAKSRKAAYLAPCQIHLRLRLQPVLPGLADLPLRVEQRRKVDLPVLVARERRLQRCLGLRQQTGRGQCLDLLRCLQPGDVLETYADITAIADELGFAPSTPIEVGIPDFVDWYRAYRGRST